MRIIEKEKYTVSWSEYAGGISTDDDNLDVHVELSNGVKYVATFFTLENIQKSMNRYSQSGECASGTYFWASDMVIVKTLSEEDVIKAVDDLVETGELETAFLKIPSEEDQL